VTVTKVRVDDTGHGIVTFSQNLAGTPPACVMPSYGSSLAFDTNTSAGRAVLALVLSAKATGVTLNVFAGGTCTIYGNSWVEDWHIGEQA
jgi:hypothetical protein